MSDKLPEWPEELEQPCGLGDVISYYTWAYKAALARMEALVEELRDLAAVTLPQKDERYMRIHELLTACERNAT